MLPGTYKKRDFCFGRQDIQQIAGIKSIFYVMPSSSARCAAFPTSETKLPWFRDIKALKEKLKGIFQRVKYGLIVISAEEAEVARKGVAGISGIGRTIENFQTTFVGSGLDTKIYARRETNENEARKGKKRPNEDQDHPKTKLKHMVSVKIRISIFDVNSFREEDR